MTDQRPTPAKDTPKAEKPEPFVPVWLRRRNQEGQAKDLTGAVRS